MTSKEERVERHSCGGRTVLGLALVALFALGGCSSVPDALNPAEWWRSASGDDQQAAKPANKPIPGEKEAFPKLGSTPDADAARARRPEARGLVGDSSSRYGEAVTRQGAPSNPLGPPEAAPSAPPPPIPVIPAAPTSQRPGETAQVVAAVTPPRMPEPPTSAAAPPAAPEPPRINAPAPAVVRPVAAPATAERAIAPMPTPIPVAPRPAAAVPADATVVVSSEGISFEQSSTARAPGAATMAAFVPPGQGAVRVATIQFGTGSAVIDESDQTVLRQVAAIFRQQGGKRVTIVGHASSRTRDMTPARHIAVNEDISVQRAHAVARALAAYGVRSDMIETQAASDQQPIYYEIMPSGEAGNRRTEVYVEF